MNAFRKEPAFRGPATLLIVLLIALLGLLTTPSALAAPAGACALSQGQWGEGPAVDARRWSGGGEDLLLVGAGAELVVFNIAAPTAPVELGRVMVGHPITSLAVSDDGQMASVSDWRDNVTLVDVSNRSMPVTRGSFAWPGVEQPTGMVFDGDHLLVAVRTIGLSILDISDPDAPAFVANSDGSVSDFVFDVALHGDYAYLAQGNDGLHVVDVSDPNNPTVVGSVPATAGAGRIEIGSNRAYVARGNQGFSILDLSSPAAPSVIGSVHADDDNGGGDPDMQYVFETALLPGDRIALADSNAGSVIYDISNEASPVEAGFFGPFPTAYRVEAAGNHLFVMPPSFLSTPVRVVDVTPMTTPTQVASIGFADTTPAVSVGLNHVLAANQSGGLVMLNTANPVQPVAVGHLPIEVNRVGHVNGHGVASLSLQSTVRVIDPQPGGPVVVASFDTGDGSSDLVGDGNRLYVAAGLAGGLRIYDMSTPSSPAFLGSYVPTSTYVTQVAASGNTAYAGWINNDQLLVIDVSNPALPAEIGSHTLPSSIYAGPEDIAASGNHVFVGTQVNGVRILEHDGTGNLTEVADIDVFPASVTGVAIDGDRLYITAGVFSGLLVYDVTDPANPQFVEQFNTSGDALGVSAANGVIAVSEGQIGVSTFGCDTSGSNQSPVAVGSISDQSSIEGESIFPLSTNPNFNDPDGQALSFSATGLPPGLSITPGSGVVQGTIEAGSAAIYPVTITATDPFDLFATQAFNWTVRSETVFSDGFE